MPWQIKKEINCRRRAGSPDATERINALVPAFPSSREIRPGKWNRPTWAQAIEQRGRNDPETSAEGHAVLKGTLLPVPGRVSNRPIPSESGEGANQAAFPASGKYHRRRYRMKTSKDPSSSSALHSPGVGRGRTGESGGYVTAPRKTLGLTGITLKTMTLMAPGALVWVFFPLQAALLGGAGDMWAGTILALIIAVITALSYSELSRAFPNAGGRGSYFFAQKAFLDRERPIHPALIRTAKKLTGWAAHLYYWVYPGVLVAFLTSLIISLFGQFGVDVLLPGRILLVGMVVVLAAMLTGRGISGSSASAVATNLVQMLALAAVCASALLFRWQNPLGITVWQYASPAQVFSPASFAGTLFQGAFAILILAGFESSTSLAAEAVTPRRDIPRGTVLSLLLQGLFAYLLAYAAFNLAISDVLTTATTGIGRLSGIRAVATEAGLGGLAIQIGDALLAGNGFALMLVLSITCAIVLFGLLLAAINMGVRVSFLMAQDREIPDVLGMLHDDFATPYAAVWILSVVSGVIAVLGTLDPVVLSGFVLAANAGVFLLYALICGMTFSAFRGKSEFRWIRHALLPGAGILMNGGMIAAWVVLGLSAGGPSRISTLWAIATIAVWGAIGGVFLFLARRRQPQKGRRSSYQDEMVHMRHRQVYIRHKRGETFAAIAGTLFISQQRVREIFRRYETWLENKDAAQKAEADRTENAGKR
jgi:APA family basic amino acid/polyamine antiporter